MKYEEALDKVAGALKFGIEPSLEGIRLLCEELGNPQNSFASIQVAGTNGKSSTVRYIASILHAEGLHVGLYTSPDLVDYTERFEVNGKVMPHDAFAFHTERVLAAADAIHARTRESGEARENLPQAINHAGEAVHAGEAETDWPVFTEFEYLTAIAFDYFAACDVDVAVLEVGLGGRWDSTSIVNPDVACITGIGLDHVKVLGDTLEEIAGEKAAIIRPGTKVVLGPGTVQVQQVFFDQIAACNAQTEGTNIPMIEPHVVRPAGGKSMFPTVPGEATGIYSISATSPLLAFDMVGYYENYTKLVTDKPSYQAQNIATAVCVAEEYLERALSIKRLRSAIEKCPTPGRFETLAKDPLLLIDAAHNPQSAEFLAECLRERYDEDGDGKLQLTLLLAILADKDAEGIVAALAPMFRRVIVTQTVSARALPAEELADLVEKVTGERPVPIVPLVTAIEALQSAGEDAVATGSITTAGQVKALFV